MAANEKKLIDQLKLSDEELTSTFFIFFQNKI